MNIERLEKLLRQCNATSYEEPRSNVHDEITAKMLPMVAAHIPPGTRVLDVGVGHGPALEWLTAHGFNANGVDVNRKNIDACCARSLAVWCYDQNELPDQWSEAYELVWARHVLEHSPMPLYTLLEFFRVLVPGGILYAEMPAPETWCEHEKNPNHYSVFGRKMWEELILRCGFRIVESRNITIENAEHGNDIYLSFIARKPLPEGFEQIASRGITVPSVWGFGMESIAPIFTEMLMRARVAFPNDDFEYVEIGVGKLGTMRAVLDILLQHPSPASITGYDLPSDQFNARELVASLLGTRVKASVIFEEPTQENMRPVIHFAFIDGCHCEDHCRRDWLTVKERIVPGGIVAFHDAGLEAQGQFRQWDGGVVNVRKVMAEINMQDWKLLADDNMNGPGIAFYEKL